MTAPVILELGVNGATPRGPAEEAIRRDRAPATIVQTGALLGIGDREH